MRKPAVKRRVCRSTMPSRVLDVRCVLPAGHRNMHQGKAAGWDCDWRWLRGAIESRHVFRGGEV